MRQTGVGLAALGAAVAAAAFLAPRGSALAPRRRRRALPGGPASHAIETSPDGRAAGVRRVVIPTVMAAGGITLFSRMSHGNTLRFTFVPALAVSWALYMLRLRRHAPDRARLMPLYFIALAWQFVHFA
jgi:hypothetical protein